MFCLSLSNCGLSRSPIVIGNLASMPITFVTTWPNTVFFFTSAILPSFVKRTGIILKLIKSILSTLDYVIFKSSGPVFGFSISNLCTSDFNLAKLTRFSKSWCINTGTFLHQILLGIWKDLLQLLYVSVWTMWFCIFLYI